MNKKYTICFVCTGNACRSPFAECVLKSMLEQEGMDNVEVFSRGTLDWGENPRDANILNFRLICSDNASCKANYL